MKTKGWNEQWINKRDAYFEQVIQDRLQKQKEEIVQMIYGTKLIVMHPYKDSDPTTNYGKGYNRACDIIIKKLEEV